MTRSGLLLRSMQNLLKMYQSEIKTIARSLRMRVAIVVVLGYRG